MNGKIVKRLRRIANGLPEVIINKRKFRVVLGKDIPPTVTEIEGKPIDPKHHYRQTYTEKEPVDHFEMIKKRYKAGGQDAVVNYCGAVTRYHLMKERKMKEIQKDPSKQEAAQLNPEVV